MHNLMRVLKSIFPCGTKIHSGTSFRSKNNTRTKWESLGLGVNSLLIFKCSYDKTSIFQCSYALEVFYSTRVVIKHREMDPSLLLTTAGYLLVLMSGYFDLDYKYTLDRHRAPASVIRVVDHLEGVRILQQDAFETLVSFICSANNNIKRITRLCFAIRERYGTFLGSKSYSDSELRFYAFPNLRQLSAASAVDLRQLGLGYRAEYLVKTVSALRSRGLDSLLQLRDAPYETAQEELLKYNGIGRKVADCVMLFGLGKRDVVPVDVHVKRIAMNHFGIRASSKNSYDLVQGAFSAVCPKDAGWLQAVLYIDSVLRAARQVTKLVS
ncbi:N-glycosylase/DNA lyase [Babesia sp. Xinjiang]|uniref:N-glycosylase/DNA lyase n=1 Tax=Babesia sp. Xinjiang TaxID=462227 RepID=UPI000A226AC1|nr:N-glycosylase/DNA lyase [Babesia sp. Xinjiang]ORM40575.1 N-glycosylase/DNA lyase [Babesia sp. Xinjiang]